MPTIPLWLGLAAAIPLTWSPLTVYFVITLIVSLLGWTGLAREVRGRFFALRGEDFVTAARLDGSSERRLIFRHILPSLTSHILAVVTLAIPTMIVAETALSFLGIGLKPPVVSWGVLLQDAQNIRTIATAPWLLIWPALAVVLAVLAFNFLGDGLRDAADPVRELRARADGRPTLVHPPQRRRAGAERARSLDRLPPAHAHPARGPQRQLRARHGRTLCLVGESGSGKSVTARAHPAHHRQAGARSPAARILLATPTAATTDIGQLEPSSREIRAHPRRPHRPDLPGADDARCRRSTPSAPRSSRRCGCTASSTSAAPAPRRSTLLAPGRDRRTPRQMVDRYTFEFSGGMRQRAMIAMALAGDPDILIADEPTTALDVTTQAEILDLIKRLQVARGMAMLLITHDMGIVAEVADEVAVMRYRQDRRAGAGRRRSSTTPQQPLRPRAPRLDR